MEDDKDYIVQWDRNNQGDRYPDQKEDDDEQYTLDDMDEDQDDLNDNDDLLHLETRMYDIKIKLSSK